MSALTRAEEWMLRSALDLQHDRTARQRAITECDLAERPTEARLRLAFYEETDLAALDGLREKLLPGWMQ